MRPKLPAFPDIQKLFQGKVILPDQPNYDEQRLLFYGGIDIHPAIIIRVAHAADIQTAITFAANQHLPLAVRSGGHSLMGHSSIENGIVIDLRDMKKIEVDAPNYVAWAETGLTAAEVTQELDKQNFVVGFGDTGSVGIGGITLGGGIGYLSRKFGLTIDNVLAAEIVTADGKLLTVDADHHPELFWALRGGGGNFGVVVKFKFALHKLPAAYGGMMILPASADAITTFMDLAEKAPSELSTILNIMPCPPMPFVPAEHHGKIVMMALMMFAGSAEAGEKAVAPFRKIAPPLADMVKPMRYKDIFFPEDSSYHPTAVSQNMFMKHVDKNIATIMLSQLSASTATMRVVQLRTLGGAIAQVASDKTAFAHRNSAIMVNVASFYTSAEEKVVRQKWVDDLSQTLDQGDPAVYVNFIASADPKFMRAAYPQATWKRLLEVKKKYDPENIFSGNVNIQE